MISWKGETMIRFKKKDTHPDSVNRFLHKNSFFLNSENQYREKYIELVEAIFPIINKSDPMSRLVMIANNLFEAKRGALFWFKKGKFTKTPELKASVNLTQKQVSSDGFKYNLNLVLTAFKKKHFIVNTHGLDTKADKKNPVSSTICLPLTIDGKLKAVLFHDRFHSHTGFDFFIGENNLADKLIRHISSYVEVGMSYRSIKEKTAKKNNNSQDKTRSGRRGIIYQSNIMTDLVEEVDKAAQSDTPVLIVGETGVGKELIARRIHHKSNRRKNTFVTINITTIPEGLFESELFGHEKGSFTGADHQKKGLIEVADGGTLFIDEVGEMPLTMQVKLLRAIQEKTFYRVGGTKHIHSDFRLVSATNSDLLLEACKGRFREDLYYRLNLFSFTIPPLRERGKDILLIAGKYLDNFIEKYGKQGLCLSSRTKKILLDYPWPGNVRELKNVMEKSVIMSTSNQPLEVKIQPNNLKMDHPKIFADEPTLDDLNRRYIQHVLNKTHGKISGPGGAAEVLNIGRTTLSARMKKLGVK